MKIIDTHAHYDDKAFLNDKDDLLKNLEKDGIQCIINIGADLASCHNTLEMIEQYSNVYGALGIHPSETESLTESDISWLKEKAMHPKIVAIGEIGLDYYWNEPSRDIQKKWFLMQLDLAKEIRKPIVA